MSKGINCIIRHLITVIQTITQTISRGPYQQHARHQLTPSPCMALLWQLASLSSLWKRESGKKKEKYSSASPSGSLYWGKILETTKRNQPLILGHNYPEQAGGPSKEIPTWVSFTLISARTSRSWTANFSVGLQSERCPNTNCEGLTGH